MPMIFHSRPVSFGPDRPKCDKNAKAAAEQVRKKRGVGWALVGAWKAAKALMRADPVPPEVEAARAAICAECEYGKSGRCELCGCGNGLHVRLADEYCPHSPSKWGPYVPLTVNADSKP